jgi:hypothetical protein
LKNTENRDFDTDIFFAPFSGLESKIKIFDFCNNGILNNYILVSSKNISSIIVYIIMSDQDTKIKKTKVRKRRKTKFPKEIIPIHNADKKFHETWTPDRDPLDFPHPYRAILVASPNSGKTCMIINILLRSNPYFQKIYLMHADPEATKEYDVFDDVEHIKSVPPPEFFDPEKKQIFILDDVEFSNLNKIEKGYLNRLFGYSSTHKNLSVLCTSQTWVSIPATARRCTNIFFLWKNIDRGSFSQLALRLGMEPQKLHDLSNKYLIGSHDSLCIDRTKNTPYPLRRNGYELIEQ